MKHVSLIAAAAISLALAVPATADPATCRRDNADAHVIVTHSCHVHCLAIAKDSAPKTSSGWIYYHDVALEVTATCTMDNGEPGFTGHGAGCYPQRDFKFLTPCDVHKDIYKSS